MPGIAGYPTPEPRADAIGATAGICTADVRTKFAVTRTTTPALVGHGDLAPRTVPPHPLDRSPPHRPHPPSRFARGAAGWPPVPRRGGRHPRWPIAPARVGDP